MAERAVHTTAEIMNSTTNQPSFFEVLAQDSLLSGLRPAARHLSNFLAWSYPNLFSGFARRFDEWYTLADFLLQNYYLKHYSATFSENFYDMKRVLASNGKNLPRSHRWRSLIAVVLIPYIRIKLDQLHERLKKESEKGQKPASAKWTRLKDAFLTIYPLICAGLEFWTLILQAGYILSKTSVHSPWLTLAGVRLERMTPEDYNLMNVSAPYERLPPDASIWMRFYHMIRISAATLLRLLSKLFGIALLLIQFLDYWQTSDRGKHNQSLSSLPIPPPPHTALTEQSVIQMDPRLCPICRRVRQNDTVVAVSGYVYCYVCIAKYVQQHRCCPVTKVPATTEHLVRLYIQPYRSTE